MGGQETLQAVMKAVLPAGFALPRAGARKTFAAKRALDIVLASLLLLVPFALDPGILVRTPLEVLSPGNVA